MKQRRKLISHFIRISVKLLALRNFAGLMSLFIGLTLTPVSRMEITWRGISKDLIDKWNKIQVLCSPISNFKNLREIHDNCLLPSVKAPSLFIKDLTIMEEIDKYIITNQEGKEDLWNMYKIQKIGKMVQMISHCQTVAYDIKPNPKLLDFLSKLYVVDLKTRETNSRKNEPTIFH